MHYDQNTATIGTFNDPTSGPASASRISDVSADIYGAQIACGRSFACYWELQLDRSRVRWRVRGQRWWRLQQPVCSSDGFVSYECSHFRERVRLKLAHWLPARCRSWSTVRRQPLNLGFGYRLFGLPQ
jgi:hypothetical protein